MELSKDKAVAMQQMVDVMLQGYAEAREIDTRTGFVVCFAEDFLPFRKNAEGHISAFGGPVHVVTKDEALRLSVILERKGIEAGKSAGCIDVLSTGEWSKARAEVISKLILQWVKSAQEQGVTLNAKGL